MFTCSIVQIVQLITYIIVLLDFEQHFSSEIAKVIKNQNNSDEIDISLDHCEL